MKSKLIILCIMLLGALSLTACGKETSNTTNSNNVLDQDESYNASVDAELNSTGSLSAQGSYSDVLTVADLTLLNQNINNITLRSELDLDFLSELDLGVYSPEKLPMEADLGDVTYEYIEVSELEQLDLAMEKSASDYADSNGAIVTILTITSDIVITGDAILTADGTFDRTPSYMMNGGILVIPDGVTLTLASNSLLVASDGITMGEILIQNGGSLIIEENAHVFCQDGFYIENGGSLRIENGYFGAADLFNAGSIEGIVSADTADNTLIYITGNLFNGSSGSITMEGSITYTPLITSETIDYDSEAYGQNINSLGSNSPYAVNLGEITVKSGSLDFTSELTANKSYPFINAGSMNLASNGAAAMNLIKIHFQNYGQITLTGNPGAEAGCIYSDRSIFENFGSVTSTQEDGYTINGTGIDAFPTYIIGYTGSDFGEVSSTTTDFIQRSGYVLLFFDVEPTNELTSLTAVEQDFLLPNLWAGSFTDGDNSMLINISKLDGDRLLLEIGSSDEADTTYASSSFSTYQNDEGRIALTAYNTAGNYEEYSVQITLSESYNSIEYTMTNAETGEVRTGTATR